MTITEKIGLAEEEVKQAKSMIEYTRKDLLRWQNRYDLRFETLQALKEATKPKRKVKTS